MELLDKEYTDIRKIEKCKSLLKGYGLDKERHKINMSNSCIKNKDQNT